MNTERHGETSLQGKNVTILGRRTSVRLEPEMWESLYDIAQRENTTVHELCSLIALRKRSNSSLTASIRVFILLYYRTASTEEGHEKVGHGSFERMAARAKINCCLKTGTPLGQLGINQA